MGVPDGTMIRTNRVYPVGQAGEGLRANSRARIRSTTERDGGCVVISGTRGVMSRYAARCRKIVKYEEILAGCGGLLRNTWCNE